MEIKWGLIPDLGGTQALRHLVRHDLAKELVFTGRIVSGTEAAELGLVTPTILLEKYCGPLCCLGIPKVRPDLAQRGRIAVVRL